MAAAGAAAGAGAGAPTWIGIVARQDPSLARELRMEEISRLHGRDVPGNTFYPDWKRLRDLRTRIKECSDGTWGGGLRPQILRIVELARAIREFVGLYPTVHRNMDALRPYDLAFVEAEIQRLDAENAEMTPEMRRKAEADAAGITPEEITAADQEEEKAHKAGGRQVRKTPPPSVYDD